MIDFMSLVDLLTEALVYLSAHNLEDTNQLPLLEENLFLHQINVAAITTTIIHISTTIMEMVTQHYTDTTIMSTICQLH